MRRFRTQANNDVSPTITWMVRDKCTRDHVPSCVRKESGQGNSGVKRENKKYAANAMICLNDIKYMRTTEKREPLM
jgi:hypothetical protein